MRPPLIYNLFPRLVGPTDRWAEHAGRAAEMAFNWLYINPWHYAGFSGSLYAPKEFRRLNPLFAPAGADTADLSPLRRALEEIRGVGLRPMMDLVINHTSKDATLADEQPTWYVRDAAGELVSPSVADPDDPSKVTVWGDLAEIDNFSSPDRERLWEYWAALVRDSLALGFEGFRCDAAYKVPSALWRFLIDEAHRVDPDARFFAETLGAPVHEVLALRDAGFDFFFNSSKWWNFREPWALEQHEQFGRIAPSIAFPESHDTTRLAADTGGSEAVQRQRYAFAAAFSAGVMITVGYEFGFQRPMHVVETMPEHWEEPLFDLRPFVARVNRLKLDKAALQGEGSLSAVEPVESDLLILRRRADDGSVCWVLLNKREGEEAVATAPAAARADGVRLFRVCRDDAPAEGEPISPEIPLRPAEVAYLLPG